MTELIWDGKYKDGKKQGAVRIALPFQTIETVNESAQDRQRSLELFSAGRQTEWRNRLIWGDKKYVLPSLLPEFAGKVKLIYIDPPFNTGQDFSFVSNLPDSDESFIKQPSVLEQKAYRDTWSRGLDSYLEWFYETVVLLRELLSDDGSIYVHLDWHVGHYAKAIMDEVFGLECFRNEIVWKRDAAGKGAKTISKQWPRIFDSILFYSKGADWHFNQQFAPLTELQIKEYHYQDPDGRKFKRTTLGDYTEESIRDLEKRGLIYTSSSGQKYKKYYLDEGRVTIDAIWTDIFGFGVVTSSKERVNYDTQKPEALLERIIKASSSEGELVLDCFVGSGTAAVVAEKLNRRWIACDLSRFAIHTTRKRLLGISNVKPFVVQNLGKYERQAWQAAEFGGLDVAPGFTPGTDAALTGGPKTEDAGLKASATLRERESAYRQFILHLYHAKPITGHTWLHGTKAGRMVHVGAVDAPVTLADVKAIAREVWKIGGVAPGFSPAGEKAAQRGGGTKAAADILGWEFAFEVNELAKRVAAESRVDVAFKKIPRDVLDKKAVEQGDVKFFELGALSVDVKLKAREVRLKLTDFVIPTDDIPEEARKAIKHWSQLVDYWAVDWDYKDDTFHNQWQSYRTRKNPKIELETRYAYSGAGKYVVVVKVIDILGNDTTKTLEVNL